MTSLTVTAVVVLPAALVVRLVPAAACEAAWAAEEPCAALPAAGRLRFSGGVRGTKAPGSMAPSSNLGSDFISCLVVTVLYGGGSSYAETCVLAGWET